VVKPLRERLRLGPNSIDVTQDKLDGKIAFTGAQGMRNIYLEQRRHTVKSYSPEVIADSTGKWSGNALRFATRAEAEIWVKDLSYRWMAVIDTRVVETDDPVTYSLADGVLTEVK